MISEEIIDAMLESGCTAEQLAFVIKAAVRANNQKIEEKREKDRERQRRHRESRDVTVTECDKKEKKQKRKEPKEKNKKIKNNNPPLIPPKGVDGELWTEFLQNRKRLKAQNTPQALTTLVNRVEAMAAKGYDPNELVATANSNGWKTVYEPKESKNGTSKLEIIADQHRKVMDKYADRGT